MINTRYILRYMSQLVGNPPLVSTGVYGGIIFLFRDRGFCGIRWLMKEEQTSPTPAELLQNVDPCPWGPISREGTPLFPQVDWQRTPKAVHAFLLHLCSPLSAHEETQQKMERKNLEPSPARAQELAALAALTLSLSAAAPQRSLESALDILRDATGAEAAELFLAEPAGRAWC